MISSSPCAVTAVLVCRAATAQKRERLAAVYNKFRALVPAGTSVALSWHAAAPAHRHVFENFFAGWKPLPPSMSGPAGKSVRKAARPS